MTKRPVVGQTYTQLLLQIKEPIKKVDGSFPSFGRYTDKIPAVSFSEDGLGIEVNYCVDFTGTPSMISMKGDEIPAQVVDMICEGGAEFDEDMPITI